MVEAIYVDEPTNYERHIADLDMCKNVLETRRNILGEDHPDTIRTISNIAFLYIQLGKQTEAFQMYEKVVDIHDTLRERFENECTNHCETMQRALNAEMRAEDLQQKYVQTQQNLEIQRTCIERLQEEINLQHKSAQEQQELVLFTEDSLTHKMAGTQCRDEQSALVLPPPPPVPPTPPPVPSAPPPIPPAPPLTMIATKNKVPQPSVPLKIFNWVKLPDVNLQDTVWAKLDCSKWYKKMGVESFDKLFSASQLPNDGSSIELKNRTKNISVIDGQRAQNGGIMLKKLKMSVDEVSRAILSMDSKDELSIDKLELLLKFTPSVEETTLLNKHSENVHSLDKADKFLYQISKIHHYDQRLKNLLFKKKFKMTVFDLSQQITNVKEASQEIADSMRLRKLLELVLAFGNYMSRGPNRNASGFRLVSLNRLSDTKSTAKEITLMHYLIQVIDKQEKDLFKLEEDIPHVRLACRVSLTDTSNGIEQLKTGLNDISKGMSVQSESHERQIDRFLPVISEFHAQALKTFTELEDKFKHMKTSFDKALRLFREDSSMQPDEFFEIVDVFLTSFMKARQDNDNFKKRQETEEKRARHQSKYKEPMIEQKAIKGLFVKFDSKNVSKEECVDLESTLQVGEGMSNLKRLRKPKLGGAKDVQDTSMPLQRLHSGESGERNVVERIL